MPHTAKPDARQRAYEKLDRAHKLIRDAVDELRDVPGARATQARCDQTAYIVEQLIDEVCGL